MQEKYNKEKQKEKTVKLVKSMSNFEEHKAIVS